jgi:hypothetical protein
MTIIGLGDTLTLMSTTSTSVDDNNVQNALTTTATGIISTASVAPTPRLHLDFASTYIDSLSDEELVALDEKLNTKELEFIVDDSNKVEQVKVYKKI